MFRLLAARHFEAGSTAPCAARSFVESTLREHGASELSDALLATSELATNAVTHACSDFDVRVLGCQAMIRIEVEDHDGELPRVQAESRERSGGRGLAIVAGVSEEWGVDQRAPREGKVVWCLLPCHTRTE